MREVVAVRLVVARRLGDASRRRSRPTFEVRPTAMADKAAQKADWDAFVAAYEPLARSIVDELADVYGTLGPAPPVPPPSS